MSGEVQNMQSAEWKDHKAANLSMNSKAGFLASDYDFHVVAIGASAGGLESLERFFAKVPRDSGMAYVVLQHLSPDFRSVMDELLARQTDIPIRQAEEGLEVIPDTIFLIPPKKEAMLSGGRFRLRDKEPRESLTLPIDHFFRSLAQEAGPRSIAIVLSGSGSDGSRGVRDVHEAGGLVLCESEETAKFDGMPLAAQESGVVDQVLRPEAMPDALLRYSKNRHEDAGGELAGNDPLRDGADTIFQLLHAEYGIDFSYYKSSTVGRRIQRRLQIHHIRDVEEYAARLREDPGELNSLYRDLLIGVTQFFRDPEAFEVLEEEILPKLIHRVGREEDIRVWIAGCATGEEAYSLAILLHEKLAAEGRPTAFKIFATDVHTASLDIASAGEYRPEAVVGVSEDRLERYFEREADHYVVIPELRKTIVFAPHNLLKDAPFTKLDLILCRNLLIYFQPPAQKKALSLFQFGLKTNGFLMLGPSESPGALQDEFETIDGHWKVYRKHRDTTLPADFRCPLPNSRIIRPRTESRAPAAAPSSRAVIDAALLRAYDWILGKYVPAALLIDDRNEVLHVFGGANSLLKPRSGRPTTDALELFDGSLRMAVMSALHRVRKDGKPVSYQGVQLDPDGEDSCRIVVEQVENPKASRAQYLISIHPTVDKTPAPAGEHVSIDARSVSQDRIDALENDLRFAQENLQATVEELETANEEMQASNEELVASNEELQSTNEELHSVNEELYTVNAEYQKKIYELTEMSADMDNLMECTEVATVFLDSELRIRKFTPQIVPVFKLLSQDVGRCIDNFAHHLNRDNLIPDIIQVLESGERIEEETQTDDGHWWHLRVLPYRSEKITRGVVLTLIDIDTLKRTEQSLSRTLKEREEFIAVLSHELRNPVNAILGASRMISSQQAEAEEKVAAAAVVERQSNHISRLLEDLLDVSRMTQNKLQLRLALIDFRETVSAAVEATRPVIDQHRQTLQLEICDEPLWVNGDEHRLSQVVANLLVNAGKYSPDTAVIRLRVHRDGPHAVAQVVDNGQGIAAEAMQYLFTPFTQSSQTWHHCDGGMGIGLSLAKSIVDRHGGHIDVHSGGQGQGSRFTVRIPLAQPADSQHDNDRREAASIDSPARTSRKPRTIVIVEDQDDSREMLRRLLTIDGHDVSVACDGEEGIQAILAKKPQVAIIDLGLPKLNGYGVAKNVRARLGDDIHLIALTGHGSPRDVKAAMDAGFDQHMVKPVNFERLDEVLQRDGDQ